MNEFITPAIKRLLGKSALIGIDSNDKDIEVFRKLLEIAMSQGRWSGSVPKLS